MAATGPATRDTAWAEEVLASRGATLAAPSCEKEEEECSEATGLSHWSAATPMWRQEGERAVGARGLGESASVAGDYAPGARGVAEAARTTPDR